jgi:hypothetical protein
VVKTALRMMQPPSASTDCRVVTHSANMPRRCGPCWCVFAW